MTFYFDFDSLFHFACYYKICRMFIFIPVQNVSLLRGYSHTTARRMLPARTKCYVQLIKLLLTMD